MTEDNVRQMWSDAELDAALHDLHPTTESEDALANARAALMAAAGGAEHIERRMERPPAKKGGGSWRWIAVAAAVAALTGGLVVAKEITSPAPPDVGGPVGPTDHTILGPDMLKGYDPPLPAKGYRHIVRSEWVLEFSPDGKNAAYVEQRLERWIPADPHAQWQLARTQTNNVHWLTRSKSSPDLALPNPSTVNRFAFGGNFDVPTGYGTGSPTRTNLPLSSTTTRPAAPTTSPGPWRVLNADFITGLPADAGTLRKMLAIPDPTMPAGDVTAEEALTRVRDVLGIGLATGPQRVALCQALAMYPGVNVQQDTAGPGGSRGLRFEVNGFDHMVLVVDPATAQVVSTAETERRKTGDLFPRSVNYLESNTIFSITLKPGS